MGHPVGPLATLDHPDLNGAYTRQFEKGKVVFNPTRWRPATATCFFHSSSTTPNDGEGEWIFAE